MYIKNNLLLSIRHLRADKTNTSINLAGLILGLAIVSVVIVFILNELGYNSFFAHRNNIYRVLNYNISDKNTWAETPFIIGKTLLDEFAEVDKCVHTYNIGNIEIKKDNDFIHEPKMLCTESAFFEFFGVKLQEGSLAGFDQTENKVLISK